MTVVGVKLGQHGIVILNIDDHVDEPVVFGRCPDHGRPADVDIFDRGVIVGAGRHRGLERVKVHDQHIDWPDAMHFHRGQVACIVA